MMLHCDQCDVSWDVRTVQHMSINLIHHFNRMKDKKYDHLNRYKISDKIQPSFMRNALIQQAKNRRKLRKQFYFLYHQNKNKIFRSKHH